MSRQFRLKDKVTIITGAGQGIGAACAHLFAREGAHVIVADIDPVAGKKTAGAINEAYGDLAAFHNVDTGDAAQVNALVNHVVENFDQVDVLINNAGVIHKENFLDLAEDDFDRVIRVNLKGYFLTGQAVARAMVKAGKGGAIINMSSVNAVFAIPDQVPYNVSKGGVNQLTRVMSLGLAPHNIRVNGIGPGSILTDMLKVVMDNEAARNMILSRTPMGRAGEPEEIAEIAAFLASDAASYITGQTIYADGGRMGLNYTVPVSG